MGKKACGLLCSSALIIAGCSAAGNDLLSKPPDRARIVLTAQSLSIGEEGGAISVDLSNTGGEQLNWRASVAPERASSGSWVRIDGASSGTGEATIRVRFERNEIAEERSATLTVSDIQASNSPQTVTLVQAAGVPPVLTASSSSYRVAAVGGRIVVDVSCARGAGASRCSEVDWTASLSLGGSWARFSGPTRGSGTGQVVVRVDPNRISSQRGFELRIEEPDGVRQGGAEPREPVVLNFVQEAAEPPRLVVDVSSFTVSPEGGRVLINISDANAGAGGILSWTVSVDQNWAVIFGASNGEGRGSLAVDIDPNSGSRRRLTITVSALGAVGSPRSLTITQTARPQPPDIVLEVEASSVTVPHTGGTVRINISDANNGEGGLLVWGASLNREWAVISGASRGVGTGSLVVVVDENSGDDADMLRRLTVTIVSPGAVSSPQTLTITQEPAPERPPKSVLVRANKYEAATSGDRITVTIDTSGDNELAWTVGEINEASACQGYETPPASGDDDTPQAPVITTYDRGNWVRLVGPSRGTGDGAFTLQVDPFSGLGTDGTRCRTLNWAFQVPVSFPGENGFDQMLHFIQLPAVVPGVMTLWTASRQVGSGGETVEAHLNINYTNQVYWIASVSEPWVKLQGPITGQIDGSGSAVIRVRVDANPSNRRRSFKLRVASDSAGILNSPQSIEFTQAAARGSDVVGRPPPLAGTWDNDCQSTIPGFEELGEWIDRNGFYAFRSNGRVNTVRSGDARRDSKAISVLSECSSPRRLFALAPNSLGSLPDAAEQRVAVLDLLSVQLRNTSGELYSSGARHPDPAHVWTAKSSDLYPRYTNNALAGGPKFLHIEPLGDWGYGSQEGWESQLEDWSEKGFDMSKWTETARENGWRLPGLRERTSAGQAAIKKANSALWMMVGGYTGKGEGRLPHPRSAVCGEMKELCLFAPWSSDGINGDDSPGGTHVAAAQVAALVDSFLTVWPDFDLLEMRKIIFNCAQDMGVAGPDSIWGHGALDARCLFDPRGNLKDPRTGQLVSGGIYGPGFVSNAFGAPVVSAVDDVGRNFAYSPFAPMWRENNAMLAAMGETEGIHARYRDRFTDFFSDVEAIRNMDQNPGFAGNLYPHRSVDSSFGFGLRVVGDAIALSGEWRALPQTGFAPSAYSKGMWGKMLQGFVLKGGLALQKEGAGPLTGEQTFRAPAVLSTAFGMSWERHLAADLAVRIQGRYWFTLASDPRSLWTGTQLAETRSSAVLVYKQGRGRYELGFLHSGGLSGHLNLAMDGGKKLYLAPRNFSRLSLKWTIGF